MKRRDEVLRVAIICPMAGQLFGGQNPIGFGGMEVRAATFAKALAHHAHAQVTVVVYSSRADAWSNGGVQVQQWPALHNAESWAAVFTKSLEYSFSRIQLSKRFPGITLRQPDFPLLWRAPLGVIGLCLWRKRMYVIRHLFRDLDADVYCFIKPSLESMVGLEYLSKLKRPTVLLLANDIDVGPHVFEGSYLLCPKGDTYGYVAHRSITTATSVVVQTHHQQQLLREKFDIDSTIVRNPINLDIASKSPPHPTPYVLWVGRGDDTHKRPRLCFDLAGACQDLRFVMIMNPVSECQQNKLKQLAPPNVTIIDRVPFDAIDAYFQHALAFVSTSAFEGFPNTFLQAGKHGVPVLSLQVDPDQILERHGGGVAAKGDMQRLAEALERVSRDRSYRNQMGQAMHMYVREHHDLTKQTRRLAKVLRSTVQ